MDTFLTIKSLTNHILSSFLSILLLCCPQLTGGRQTKQSDLFSVSQSWCKFDFNRRNDQREINSAASDWSTHSIVSDNTLVTNDVAHNWWEYVQTNNLISNSVSVLFGRCDQRKWESLLSAAARQSRQSPLLTADCWLLTTQQQHTICKNSTIGQTDQTNHQVHVERVQYFVCRLATTAGFVLDNELLKVLKVQPCIPGYIIVWVSLARSEILTGQRLHHWILCRRGRGVTR